MKRILFLVVMLLICGGAISRVFFGCSPEIQQNNPTEKAIFTLIHCYDEAYYVSDDSLWLPLGLLEGAIIEKREWYYYIKTHSQSWLVKESPLLKMKGGEK